MKRCMKKRVAILLAAATLITSSGMSSLAATFEGSLKGKQGSDYYLVNLDAGQEEFSIPYEYVATQSNGTASNALVKKDGSSKITTFAVDSTEKLNLSTIRNAASKAGLPYSSDGERVWLKSKDDLSTQIQYDEVVPVTNKMTLYAALLKEGKVEATDPTLEGLKITSFGGDDVVLTVKDIKSEDKLNNLADLEKAIDGRYTGISYDDILQMDIEPSAEYKNGKIVIRMKLPNAFTNKIRSDKKIIALHKKADSWEVRDVKRVGAEYSNEYEFDLDSFSPVVLAVVDNTIVNVTLENVPGAVGIAYSVNSKDSKRTLTYLPIGEKVPVPAGTELRLEGEWEDYDHYTLAFKVQAGDKSETLDNYSSYIVEEVENIIITPVLKKADGDNEDNKPSVSFRFKDSLSKPKPAKVTSDISLRYNKNIVEATNWRLLEFGAKGVDSRGYSYNYSREEQYQNEKFSFTGNTLSSNEELEIGYYRLLIACDYNKETFVMSIGFSIGVQVYYNVLLARPEYNEYNDYAWTVRWVAESEHYISGEKNFGEITREAEIPEIRFFGNKYEQAGWMQYNGDEIKEDSIINKSMEAYALFKDKEGKAYHVPTVKAIADADKPGTNKPSTDIPSRGSSSTRGSNSSSTTVSNSGTSGSRNLVGTWKRDAKGWWFQLSSGGYQKNNWGILNGSWYYFGADGYMKTGWIEYNGAWYYTNPAAGADEGKMMTGWIYDESIGKWFYLGRTGMMETGWIQINGVWYYLNPTSDGTKGAMAANTWIGNYYVGANGAWDQNRNR